MLNTKVKGTVDESNISDSIKSGDKGEAATRLAPMGKILINGQVREAKSIEGYVDEHTAIEIVSVEGKHITVKPIKIKKNK
jgi:membrane-bound ClpP family serine protease